MTSVEDAFLVEQWLCRHGHAYLELVPMSSRTLIGRKVGESMSPEIRDAG